MRKWIEKILPGYSVLPLILAVSINMLVYFGTSQLRDYLTFHTITTALDEWIPFVAPFILFYVLAYIQWIANYLLVAREGKEFCYRIVYGDVAAKVICLLFFLFFPTTLARPEVTGSGFCNDLVRFIYRMDAPVNLFPSIHCLESWCCIHAAFAMKKPLFLFDTIFTKKKKHSHPVYRRNCFVSTNSLPGLLQQKTALPGGRAVLGYGKEAEYYRVLQNSFR